MFPTLLTSLIVLGAILIVVWLISIVRRDASIADVFWGSGFVLVAWVAAWVNFPFSSRIWLLLGLVTIWGLRLTVHLLRRNLAHGEDRRYVAMREKYGPRFARVSLVSVFFLQGIILWFVSLPLQVATVYDSDSPLNWLDFTGVALWVTGMFFETVGDWQLSGFLSRAENRGKVMDRGLWRYTRHPNYFGDFCVWWGLYLVSASGGAAWTFPGPLLMSYLLIRVSGVKLLESTISKRRAGYADYIRRTNAFFPGPPRKTPR